MGGIWLMPKLRPNRREGTGPKVKAGSVYFISINQTAASDTNVEGGGLRRSFSLRLIRSNVVE